MGVIAGWGVNEWVAAVSALLALASFLFNWAVVRRQTLLQFESLKAQMDADTMAWAHEAIDLVSEGVALARGRGAAYAPDELRRRVLETAQKLSSSADRGRMFFPNQAPDAHGAEKEAAFQGYRPPILDAVIFACLALEKVDAAEAAPDDAAAEYLIKCRRLLISEVQAAIDPRRRGMMLRKLASGGRAGAKKSSFRIAAELGMTLEARYPGSLTQPRDEAWIAGREAMARRLRH